MLRLLRFHNSRVNKQFRSTCLTDYCCDTRRLFSTDSQVAPQRVTSLRRRRSAQRANAQTADNMTDSLTDIVDEETEHMSRIQRNQQHQITSADISVDLLKDQLNEAVSVPLPEDELEFPSDISDKQKWKEFSRRDQAKDTFRPRISPMDTSIVLFPGHDSQYVGMGAKLLAFPNVEKLYKTASNILGYSLLDMCLYGPKDVLSKTVYSQPAVLVTSLAAVEKLKEVCPKAIENCITAAGYDVGEYAALVFAGAMSFEDAVRVVKVRASAMQSASQLVPSGMIKVYFGASGRVGKACHLAKMYCRQEMGMPDAVCGITTYLYPGCKIISGNREALEFIDKNRREFGIKLIEQLPASGAFHTRLMHPTISAVSRAIAAADLREPIIPIHSNVTANRYHTVESIRSQLVNQLWKPIRWEQTMHALYGRRVGSEFPQTFEVGPGKQLGFLLKQVNAKAFAQYDNVQV